MSYRRGNDIGSALVGIAFYGFACMFIAGLVLRRVFGISRPSGLLILIASVAVFFAFASLVWGLVKLHQWSGRRKQWRKKWKPCAHGVPGGTLGNCDVCLAEQEAVEATRRASENERLRREQIKSSARALRQEEIERLSRSIVPSLDELRRLTPQQFENEIANLFRRLGYDVKQTPYTNDQGRDAIMVKGHDKYLLECKRYGQDNASGRPDIQKFHSAIISDRAKSGFFVTSGSFSKAAVDFAPGAFIELVDGNRLVRMFAESTLSTTPDDSYESVCLQCGEKVRHSLRAPRDATCPNGHSVQPTLNLDQILGRKTDAMPTCAKCGSVMRIVQGRHAKFWGCSRYPACRYTKPFRRQAMSASG
jgi:restriction system protein